jgi:septal ring factor EnvC (AmiA/AmiB activator)
MELKRDAESLAIKYEQMEGDEASIPALQDKLRKAEQKNALLERNQKMLHEKMANIDELITKFTAVNAQLKQKSQRLAHSQQEIEQLKRQRTLAYQYLSYYIYLII